MSDDDQVVGRQLLPDLDGGGHGQPPGRAEQDALLARHLAGHEVGLLVAAGDHPVEHRGVPGVREEVLAHALGEVGPAGSTREDRALGIGGDHLDLRVHPLEVAGRAGDGPARARAGHEVGDPAAALPPDLRPGRLLVREGVGRVGVLVGAERVRDLPDQPLGGRVVAGRVLGRHRHRADGDLGAVGPQQVDLLGRDLVGGHEVAAVAPLGGDDGQPDAGVARRRLDDGPARAEQPVPLGREDHLERRAVLRRAAGVGGLQLGHEGRAETVGAGQAAQLDQRGVPDEVQHGLGDRGRRQVVLADGPHATGVPRRRWLVPGAGGRPAVGGRSGWVRSRGGTFCLRRPAASAPPVSHPVATLDAVPPGAPPAAHRPPAVAGAPARWTTADVLALAPDAAVAHAARGLAVPTTWSNLGSDDVGVWGLYRGTSAEPYEVMVDRAGPAWRCSCPSRKVPCKHTLGLLLLWAEGNVPTTVRPERAARWLAARAAAAAAEAGPDAPSRPARDRPPASVETGSPPPDRARRSGPTSGRRGSEPGWTSSTAGWPTRSGGAWPPRTQRRARRGRARRPAWSTRRPGRWPTASAGRPSCWMPGRAVSAPSSASSPRSTRWRSRGAGRPRSIRTWP